MAAIIFILIGMNIRTLLSVVTLCLPSLILTAQESYSASLSLTDTPDKAPVSEFLYGQFIEHLGRCVDGGLYEEGSPLSDERGFRKDVLKLVKDLDVPLLRFPGGTVTKIYHWKEGIGPKDQRRKRPNLIWGGNIQYRFGTAEFIEYCREIRAEPMLVVNMATGTPEEASEWVEYCNGTGDTYWANLRRAHGYPEPFGVKYWGIGNEESADADAGRHYEVDDYIAASWQFLKLMKLQDPNIDITLAGDTRNKDWNDRVLKALHPAADHLAVHFYAVPEDSTYTAFLASVYQYNEFLDTLRNQLAALPAESGLSRWYRFPGRKKPLKLAIDEWGIWDMKSPKGRGAYELEYPFNWGHALGTGAFLHLFYRNHDLIGLATWAQTVNVLAPIMTDGQKAWVQTVYLPLQEYRARMLPKYVPVRVSAPALAGAPAALDVVATQSEDGKSMVIVLLNLDPERGAVLPATSVAGWQTSRRTVFSQDEVYATKIPVGLEIEPTTGLVEEILLPPASLTFWHLER